MSDSRIEQITFNPGEVLFREGEQTFFFYVIQDGQVEIFKKAPDGKEMRLGIVTEGSSIGEFAMLDRSPRSATARALTEVTAAKVSEESYQHLITELPDWAIAVMRGMIDRLKATNEIIRRSAVVTEGVKAKVEASEYVPMEGPDPLDSNDSPMLGGDD